MDIPILCEQFCEYALSMKGYSKATVRRYKHVIRAFVRFTGIVDLFLITPEKVRNLFFYGRTERHWSAHTFLVYHVTLTVFFRWCIQQGLMTKNPVEGLEKPKIGQRIPKGLTKQEAFRLLEIVQNYPFRNEFLRIRNHAIFATFIYAGLRKQELLNLKLMDVDLENLAIYVRQGKGNKDRIVPINYSLAQILKRYIVYRKEQKKTCPKFFASYVKNIGFSENGLKLFAKEVVKASGIKFTIHGLRHTFATLMLEGGCDLYMLSRLMGHNNIATTTIYLSANTEFLRSQIIKHPLNSLPPVF